MDPGAALLGRTFESNEWERQRLLDIIRSDDNDPQESAAADRAAEAAERRVAAEMAAQAQQQPHSAR
jgi:hypothetical protein